MTDAPRQLLVLTAGSYQIPVLQRARALGLRVVATDRDANAPGLALADVAEQVDVTDRDAVLALAQRHRVDGVIAEQSDVAVRTAAFVAQGLGLPGIGVETARRATDKHAMRDACRAADVPMPAYRAVGSPEVAFAAAREIGFPVVVKPVDSQASRGVTKVTGAEQLAAAFARAVAASSSGGVLVEELLVGTEGSVESFVAAGAVTMLGFCDKVKCPPPFSYDLRLVYPGDYPPAVVRQIVELNERVVRAVGITMGLVHVEFIVTARGAQLIEVAARGCGARVATDLLPALTGVDVIGLRLRQALGEDVAAPQPRTDRAGVLQFLALAPGRIDRIADARVAGALDDVLLVHLLRGRGDVIETVESGDGRPGFVMTTGDSRAAAIAAAERAIRALDIHVTPLAPVEVA
jgi:biotin carboxylase